MDASHATFPLVRLPVALGGTAILKGLSLKKTKLDEYLNQAVVSVFETHPDHVIMKQAIGPHRCSSHGHLMASHFVVCQQTVSIGCEADAIECRDMLVSKAAPLLDILERVVPQVTWSFEPVWLCDMEKFYLQELGIVVTDGDRRLFNQPFQDMLHDVGIDAIEKT